MRHRRGMQVVGMLAALMLIAAGCSEAEQVVDTEVLSGRDAEVTPSPEPTPEPDDDPTEPLEREERETLVDPQDTNGIAAQPSEEAPPAATGTEPAQCVQRPGHDGPPPDTVTSSGDAGRFWYVQEGTRSSTGTVRGEPVDGERRYPQRFSRTRSESTPEGDGFRYTSRDGSRGDAHVVVTAERARVDRIVHTTDDGRERVTTFSPPMTLLEFPLSQGASWESTSTVASGNAPSGTTVTVRATVLRPDIVEVCDSSYPVWVIESSSNVTGPFASETHATYWVAPSLGGIWLREESQTSGEYVSGANRIEWTSTVSRSLISIVPESAD